MKSFILLLSASLAFSSPLDSRQTCPSSGISAARAAEVANAFRAAGITTDVPTGDFTPTTELTVKYGNRNENLGNEFGVLETLQEPTISFNPESGFDPATTRYTYIQVDPDAPGPSLPLLRNFLHHIIFNLSPTCAPSSSPVTQARYMPLTPLSVQSHRYISLLYRQPPGNYEPPKLNLVEDVARAPFSLEKYVAEAGLVLVGGNFMREGLGSTVCALVPGCTANGVGYNGPLDGSALDGVLDIITGA